MTGDSLLMDRFAGAPIIYEIANKQKYLEEKRVWDTVLRISCSGTYERKHFCYRGLRAM